jgi:hypothetical protein
MPFKVDNQRLQDIEKCEAAGIARHALGLQSKASKYAADIGSAFHLFLRAYFMGATTKDCLAILETEHNKIFPPGQEPEEPRFERLNCLAIAQRYIERHPLEKFPFTVVESEVVRGLPLDPNGDIMFYVKRDMLVEEKGSQMRVPVDHKTTRKINEWFSREQRMSSQITGYIWFSGQETKQFVPKAYINAIELGKLPDSNKKCPTHKVLYRECGPEHAVFQLFYCLRSSEAVEKWRQDAIVLAKKAQMLFEAFGDVAALPYALRNGAFNKQCKFCEYQKWCILDFDYSLLGDYVVYNPWEPWAEEQQQST